MSCIQMSIQPLGEERELESRRHLQGQEVLVVPPDMVAVETGLPKGCDVVVGGVSILSPEPLSAW